MSLVYHQLSFLRFSKHLPLISTKVRYSSNESYGPEACEESRSHYSGFVERKNFFKEYRDLCIQKSLENLQNQPIKIKSQVKCIFINDPSKSAGINAASLFLYETIPAVKYHNPKLKVVCTRDDSIPWNLEIEFKSGETRNIDVERKDNHKIFQEFLDLAGSRE